MRIKSFILVMLGAALSLTGFADPNYVTVNIKNQYLFGSQVKLVSGQYWPQNPAYYCPLPPSSVTTSGSFNYGACGQQRQGFGISPTKPYVTYAVYPKDATEPVLTCRLDYTWCSASASPVTKIASATNPVAECNAIATETQDGCTITFGFTVSKK